jgi:hypothetical protein
MLELELRLGTFFQDMTPSFILSFAGLLIVR